MLSLPPSYDKTTQPQTQTHSNLPRTHNRKQRNLGPAVLDSLIPQMDSYHFAPSRPTASSGYDNEAQIQHGILNSYPQHHHSNQSRDTDYSSNPDLDLDLASDLTISTDPTDITDKSCDRKRPEQQARLRSRNSVTNMSSVLMSKTVTPFLREHIPSLYAPIGKPGNQETARAQNPNSKYCYRHHPDSKCRRAADNAKMVMIQSELDKLTSAVGLLLQHWLMSIRYGC